jgi:hypothetical protein
VGKGLTIGMASKSPAARPLTVRSAISNNLLALRGVDGRGAVARRYRDVVISLADDAGGVDRLTEPQKIMVRTATMMTVKIEDIQSRIVAGENVDVEQLTRMGNVLARTLQLIGVTRGPKKDQGLSLSEYLASLRHEPEVEDPVGARRREGRRSA